MQTLGGNDLLSDVEDYEREICKYIASPINDQLDAYVDRYVLEYKEANDIHVAVMMAIALDTVNE